MLVSFSCCQPRPPVAVAYLFLVRPMSARSLRNSISSVCLWIAILSAVIGVGGNLFQMMVVDPLWSAAPPASVQAYFSDARHFEALRRFHNNPFLSVVLLCHLSSL